RRPAADAARAARPHEVWQVDAAECIRLASGELVCWLRAADELTGAALRATLFPPPAAVPGRRPAGPGGPAAGVRPLGPAGPPPGGQRRALGLRRRPPAGVGRLADRAGRRGRLEPAPPPPEERRGRAVAGGGQV